MTESPIVIDAEVEESDELTPDAPASPETTRPFRVVTHKPGIAGVLTPFGAVQDVGINVDPDTASRTLWWMPQDWAIQVLRAGVELPQLLAPHPGYMAGLDEGWLNREVGIFRKKDIQSFFEKHPEYLEEHPQVVVSTPGETSELLPPRVASSASLALGVIDGFESLPDDSMLQLDEPKACVVEVRCWVTDKIVTAAAPYRIGSVGWESGLFLEMTFNTDGQALVGKGIEAASQIARTYPSPPGYAIDIGLTIEGEVTVLRVWPAWAAEPLHADPIGVLNSITAAHDFDRRYPQWVWSPDMNVYNRPQAEDTPSEAPEAPPAELSEGNGTDDHDGDE